MTNKYHNLPDDACTWSTTDPRSPFYDDTTEVAAYAKLYEEALTGDREDLYYEIFDSMDSDVVVGLLRDFHATQSTDSINQLIVELDEMLDNRIRGELQK